MNIIEATKKALAENKCIAKEQPWFAQSCIYPSHDRSAGYVIVRRTDSLRQKVHKRWAPSTEDVLADNWVVLEEPIILPQDISPLIE